MANAEVCKVISGLIKDLTTTQNNIDLSYDIFNQIFAEKNVINNEYKEYYYSTSKEVERSIDELKVLLNDMYRDFGCSGGKGIEKQDNIMPIEPPGFD